MKTKKLVAHSYYGALKSTKTPFQIGSVHLKFNITFYTISLQLDISLSFELQFENHLRCWVSNFLSFKFIYKTPYETHKSLYCNSNLGLIQDKKCDNLQLLWFNHRCNCHSPLLFCFNFDEKNSIIFLAYVSKIGPWFIL